MKKRIKFFINHYTANIIISVGIINPDDKGYTIGYTRNHFYMHNTKIKSSKIFTFIYEKKNS